MSNIIKDVFKVHNMVVARSLSGQEKLTPGNLERQFEWSSEKVLNMVAVFRAIEPSALTVHFTVICHTCEHHIDADAYVTAVNNLGTYDIKCEQCGADIKVGIDKMNPYFRINPSYAKSREEFV